MWCRILQFGFADLIRQNSLSPRGQQQRLHRASLVMFLHEERVFSGDHRNGGLHLPRGKALADESPWACARRELSEEVLYPSQQGAGQCTAAIVGAAHRGLILHVEDCSYLNLFFCLD